MTDQELIDKVWKRLNDSKFDEVLEKYRWVKEVTDAQDRILVRYTRWIERAKTKWEVGEMLCCLVGNTMLANHKEGQLLGEQLTPFLNYCKGEQRE